MKHAILSSVVVVVLETVYAFYSPTCVANCVAWRIIRQRCRRSCAICIFLSHNIFYYIPPHRTARIHSSAPSNLQCPVVLSTGILNKPFACFYFAHSLLAYLQLLLYYCSFSETHLGSFKYCIRLECTGTSIRPLLAGASLVRKGIINIFFINFVYWRAVYLLAVAIRILLL